MDFNDENILALAKLALGEAFDHYNLNNEQDRNEVAMYIMVYLRGINASTDERNKVGELVSGTNATQKRHF